MYKPYKDHAIMIGLVILITCYTAVLIVVGYGVFLLVSHVDTSHGLKGVVELIWNGHK